MQVDDVDIVLKFSKSECSNLSFGASLLMIDHMYIKLWTSEHTTTKE